MMEKTNRPRRAEEKSMHRRIPGPGDPVATRAGAIEIARALNDDKCYDVVVLDVTGLSQVSDYLVIASGTSDRQMRSAGDNAGEVAERYGLPVHRRSVDDLTTWIVLDCIDVVVHIFEPNTRAHYDLEMLWGDAKTLEWERTEGAEVTRVTRARRVRA